MAPLDRSLIAGSPTFAGMTPEALDDVLAQAAPLRLPKGEAAFRQGEHADRFFLLLHGRLRVTRINAQGQQMVVRFISPGDMFGVAMAIQVEAYPGTATAAVDSLALSWPNAAWRSLSRTTAAACSSSWTLTVTADCHHVSCWTLLRCCGPSPTPRTACAPGTCPGPSRFALKLSAFPSSHHR